MTSRQGKGSSFDPTAGTFLFLMLASMMNIIGGAAVAPALPLMSEAFPAASETVISLVVTLPALVIALIGFPIGMFADRFGKVRTLSIALVVFVVAGTSGVYLSSIEAILAGRALLGIGIGGISVCTPALLIEYYHGDTRTRAISVQGFAGGAGIVLLELCGGALANLGWRAPFFVYLVGVLILAGVIVFMREPSADIGVVDAIQDEGDAIRDGDGRRRGQAQDAADERERTSRATVTRVAAMSWASAFISQMLGFLIMSKLPYYLAEMGGSSFQSGLFLALYGLAQALIVLAYSIISRHLRRMDIFCACMASLAVAFLLLDLSTGPALCAVAVVLAGFGAGLILPTTIDWLGQVSTGHTSGKLLGGQTTFFNIGQFASTFISAALLASFGSYHTMYLIAGIISLLLLFVYLALRRRFGADGLLRRRLTPSREMGM